MVFYMFVIMVIIEFSVFKICTCTYKSYEMLFVFVSEIFFGIIEHKFSCVNLST